MPCCTTYPLREDQTARNYSSIQFNLLSVDVPSVRHSLLCRLSLTTCVLLMSIPPSSDIAIELFPSAQSLKAACCAKHCMDYRRASWLKANKFDVRVVRAYVDRRDLERPFRMATTICIAASLSDRDQQSQSSASSESCGRCNAPRIRLPWAPGHCCCIINSSRSCEILHFLVPHHSIYGRIGLSQK